MKSSWLLFCGLLAANCQQFTFGAAGDFSTKPTFITNLNSIDAANLSMMLVLGDMGYETNNETYWCQRWTAHTNLTELLIVAGNHDVGESCCGVLQTYLDACPKVLSRNGTNGIRYHIDYPVAAPLVRFIMITPGVTSSVASYNTYGTGGVGLAWVSDAIDDARARNIPWIVVGMHKNYISMLTKSDEIGAPLMNLLFTKKVDLILQAHEHGYERTKHLSCAIVNTYNPACVTQNVPVLKGNGSVIIVLGTGGQDLRTQNPTDSEAAYFATWDVTSFGFGKFTVSVNELRYDYVRSSGGAYSDSFVLTAPPTVAPTTASPTPTTKEPTTAVPTPAPTGVTVLSAAPTKSLGFASLGVVALALLQ